MNHTKKFTTMWTMKEKVIHIAVLLLTALTLSLFDNVDCSPLVFIEVNDYNIKNEIQKELVLSSDFLSRHERSANSGNNSTTSSTNSTTTPSPVPSNSRPTYKNAIEEFYADPNNRAMYLVLPLIVLVYGGCSSIYCVYKCRRYLKRKRLENQMKNSRQRDSPSSGIQIEDHSETELIPDQMSSNNNVKYPSDVPRPVTIVSRREISPEPITSRNHSRNTLHEDMPLHDLEDDAVIVTAEERNTETSFTESSSNPVNMYPRLNTPSAGSTSSPSLEKEKDKLEPQKIASKPESRVQSRIDSGENKDERPLNENVSEDRPSSKQPESRSVSKQSNSKRSEKQLPKIKKFSDLTPQDVEDILNYYTDKKHMPDVIPDDTENMLPIKRKANKWKYRVFNA